VAELGDIFDGEDQQGPKGRDLRVTVTVPQRALGRPDGYAARIPEQIEVEGTLVPREPSPHDDGDEVRLHLPEGFASGATLRLRGQGGERPEGGMPGDLYVQVLVEQLDDTPGPLALRALLGLGLLLVLIELVPNLFGAYGIFIDELYYLACADHLATGYVDHPPLAPWILAASRAILGDSQLGIRVLPALAGGGTVVLTGMIAWRMGAHARGQVLAAIAILVAPIPLIMFGFFSVNAFEILLWTLAAYILVEQARTKSPRWWLWLGLVCGLGLMNKHTFVLIALGLLVGMLLTPARKHLASKHLWLGVAIAALVFSPNLVWQIQHDWMTLGFYAGADAKNVKTPALEVFLQQVLFMNPAGVLLWAAGIWFLLRNEAGRSWRHLGWLFLTLLVLMVASQKSRPDRIAGAYPMMFAAGAVWWDRLCRARARWLSPALAGLLVLVAAPFVPVVLPIMPPQKLGPYAQSLGVVPKIERGHEHTPLPQWMEDRLGWPEMVDAVVAATNAHVAPEELARARVVAPSYGYAGALELLGRDRGLPRVVSPHNTYFLWGLGEGPIEVAVTIGFGPKTLKKLFEEVTLVRDHKEPFGLRRGSPIYVCRGPKIPLHEVWEKFRNYR
jgi:hypothetical protein